MHIALATIKKMVSPFTKRRVDKLNQVITLISGMRELMIILQILHQEEWVQINHKNTIYGDIDQTG